MPNQTPWNAFIILDEILASFSESGGGAPPADEARVHWGRLFEMRGPRGGGAVIYSSPATPQPTSKKRTRARRKK